MTMTDGKCAKCKLAALCLVRGTPAFQFDFYKCKDCGAFLLGQTLIFYDNPEYEPMSNTVEYRRIIDAEHGRHVRIGSYGLRQVTLPSCIDMERFDPMNSTKWFVRAVMCPTCLARWRSPTQQRIIEALGIPKEFLDGHNVDAT